MQIELTPEQSELFGEVAHIVEGLRRAGITGFVPERADRHMLHVALQNVGSLERRFTEQPAVSVDALKQFRALVRQLLRAVADGIIEPGAFPAELTNVLATVTSLIHTVERAAEAGGQSGRDRVDGQPSRFGVGGHND